MKKIIFSIIFLFGISPLFIQVTAAPGDLDTNFGTNGRFSLSGLNSIDLIRNNIIVQPDGKILVTGNIWTGVAAHLIVLRLNENGTFDTTFANNGLFNTSFGGLLTAGFDLALQPDGKIVVAGVTNTGSAGDANFALVRLNPNGTLDTTFDGDGKVTTTFAGGLNEFAHSVLIQPDGKIIAAGTSADTNETESYFAAARYHPNGSLDTTFDGDGRFVSSASERSLNDCYAVALQNDGKVVLGGGVAETVTAESEFALMRLHPNGIIDISFDHDGKVQIPVMGQIELMHDLIIQTDGKIVGVGFTDIDTTSGNGNDDFAIIRLTPNGSLDPSFSNDGKTTFSFNSQNDFEQAWGVAIQQNNKIVVGGVSGKVDPTNQNPILNANFATVRFNADGTLDNTFGTAGSVLTTFPTPVNLGFGVALQNDGKIVRVGYTGDQEVDTLNSKITVVRYQGDDVFESNSTPIFDFDGDSKTDVSIYRPSLGEWWYLRSSNGTNYAAQFGSASDKPIPADFTGDGKTDIAFWRPSSAEWFVLRSEDSTFYSFPFGNSTDIPAPADYDGDGQADAAVFRPSSSTWFIFRSSDNGVTIQNFGIAEDKPVVSDYDGDGKADIAIFRPSVSEWWLLRSQAGLIAYQFGASGDKTVQGDYTGDGLADIAFWRPSSGQWFILRSEDSSFFAFPFGQSGDTPVPGDYDGDGKQDAAVFRPSNNVWYISGTTSGVQTVPFGVSGDIPLPNVYSAP